MDKDISRDTLLRHAIYYDSNVYQASHGKKRSVSYALPDHVDAVRDGLLFIEKVLPEDCEATLRDELVELGNTDIGPDWCLRPQRSAFISGQHHERMLQQSPSHDNLKLCEKIAKRAQEIMEDLEPEWTFFWRDKIFRNFSDEASEQSGFRLVSSSFEMPNFINHFMARC
jgi:hypothetical protein